MDPTLEIVSRNFRFTAWDYVVFVVMLVVSVLTGIYYGYFGRKRVTEADEQVSAEKENIEFGSKSLTDYLLGSRELKVFPVAMSLIASYISGVTILGTPSEVYNYGLQYWIIVIPIVLSGFVTSSVFLPVFYPLKLTSSYEYLELRFNSNVRLLASVMFVINQILFLPIIVYVPALAFNQVSGFNLHLIGIIIPTICVFYTMIGGLRAVVATDAWQIVVMFFAVVVVAIMGTVYQGGMEAVFETLIEGGRMNIFDWNPSMYKRHTHIGLLSGFFLLFTAYSSTGQTMVQRYLAVPTLRAARTSVFIFVAGLAMFVTLCCYTGVLAYDAYAKCDPRTAGLINADDQMFPLYVMQTLGNFPGIPGLFIAGVCGAALSSLSVIYNSTSLVIYSDIIKGFFNRAPSERAATYWIKGSMMVLGLISIGGVYLVEQLGGVIAAGNALTSVGDGGTLGLFIMGMLVPWCDATSAIIGAVTGVCLTAWISFGSQAMLVAGRLTNQRLPMEWETCPPEFGNLTSIHPEVDESDVFPLYRLSFWWLFPIGVVTSVVIGSVVSYFMNKNKFKHLDPELISPVIRKWLPKECFSNLGNASKERNNNF